MGVEGGYASSPVPGSSWGLQDRRWLLARASPDNARRATDAAQDAPRDPLKNVTPLAASATIRPPALPDIGYPERRPASCGRWDWARNVPSWYAIRAPAGIHDRQDEHDGGRNGRTPDMKVPRRASNVTGPIKTPWAMSCRLAEDTEHHLELIRLTNSTSSEAAWTR